MIITHFMLHTEQKNAIVPSWTKHRWGLFRSMIGMGTLMKHMEPVLLIADYYGEKQAMYFTFLIHHISMLIIPAFFGIILWSYHIYLATQHVPKEVVGEDDEEEPQATGFITSYFAILDTPLNYVFLVILAIWITIYIESWKRK